MSDNAKPAAFAYVLMVYIIVKIKREDVFCHMSNIVFPYLT
jgi:hypothetical protein